MITKLTKKQEEKIDKYYQEGIKIGLDIFTNKEKTEENLINIYNWCGYKKPAIWWCDSPFQMQFIINILKANIWDNIGDNIGANILDNIEANIGANIGDNIRANILDNIGANILANIRANILDNIRANIWDNIWDNIGANIGVNILANILDNIRANIWDNINNYLFYYGYSQNEIYWIQYYKFFVDTFKNINWNKKAINGLKIMYNIAKYSGWWYPFENIVFVCKKPIKNIYNEKFHNTKESIIEYVDGYKIYGLNNIWIPEFVFGDKSEIDVKNIIKIQNVEQKKEIIKFLGEDWFFKKLDSKLIDSKYLYLDENQKVFQRAGKKRRPIEYRLIETDIGLSEKVKILVMDNASLEGVKHYEMVDPSCKTVLDAFESRTGIREYPVYLS